MRGPFAVAPEARIHNCCARNAARRGSPKRTVQHCTAVWPHNATNRTWSRGALHRCNRRLLLSSSSQARCLGVRATKRPSDRLRDSNLGEHRARWRHKRCRHRQLLPLPPETLGRNRRNDRRNALHFLQRSVSSWITASCRPQGVLKRDRALCMSCWPTLSSSHSCCTSSELPSCSVRRAIIGAVVASVVASCCESISS